MDAPNSWKLESKTNSLVKGKVPESLRFDIPESLDISADTFTLTLKLYLCSNGVCTVRNKNVVFQVAKNATLTGEDEIQVEA